MSLTRRNFIRASLGGVAAALLPKVSGWAVARPPGAIKLTGTGVAGNEVPDAKDELPLATMFTGMCQPAGMLSDNRTLEREKDFRFWSGDKWPERRK